MRFANRRQTGVERYAAEVLRHLGKRVRYLQPGRVVSGYKGHLWEQTQLPRLIRHGETLWSPANSGPLLVGEQVVTLHDISPLDHPEWFTPAFALWYRCLWPVLIRRAKAIVVVSQFSKNRLVDWLGLSPAKVHVAPGGVGAPFQPADRVSQEAVRRRYNLPERFILFVGTLEPRKNLGGLFRALQLLQKKDAPVTLVIAGAPGGVFRKIDLSPAAADTRFLGFVPDADLPGLYSAAFCLALPSFYEGFGFPALEAMACGTPVVAARTGALPEVVGEAGLLVDPLNDHTLAHAFLRLFREPNLRACLIERGLERAMQFNWATTARITWQVLQSPDSEAPDGI